MKNGVKNGKGTQFSSDNQPSGEAKSKGWERKRLAKEFMNRVFEMQEMTIAEFQELETSMMLNTRKHTMRDLMAKNYLSSLVKSEKMLLDWLDRHIGKAPKEVESSDYNDLNSILDGMDNEFDYDELKKLV